MCSATFPIPVDKLQLGRQGVGVCIRARVSVCCCWLWVVVDWAGLG